MMDYSRLPINLRSGAQNWIEHGIVPGDFLTAVIQNNLREAFFRADDENLKEMLTIVRWWYNEAPSECWGSIDKFKEWKALTRVSRTIASEQSSH